jgi:hypothetical protein
VRAVSPGTKFVGASLAHPREAPAFFEHFLDPKNHAPGTPLDMISYHFYATPSADQPREMIDWTTGRPNARYWTLKLLMGAFAPGDALVRTSVDSGSVTVLVPQSARASLAFVDGSTPDGIGTREMEGGVVELRPYAVAVLSVGP